MFGTLEDAVSEGGFGGKVLLRVGFGILFVFHGAPKLFLEDWTKIGEAMSYVGVDVAPALWGFIAALAEFGVGICLLLGLLTRPVCLLLLLTMIVAVVQALGEGGGFGDVAHPLKAALVFLFFLLEGPGGFSLDSWIRSQLRGENSRSAISSLF